MDLIYQRFWHSQVTRIKPEKVISITNFLDTHSEIRTVLEVGVHDLIISDALVETYRQYNNKLIEPLAFRPAIQGIKAYFGSGRPIKEAMSSHPQLIEPVLENIMALIQGEAYLYPEMGFETAQAYDDYWDKEFKGTCKFYSNLDKATERFMDNIQPAHRPTFLFGRYRNVAIFVLGSATFQVNINFSDSFHEMAINFTCQGSKYRVTEITGWMLRCPDPVCQQALLDLKGIIGCELAESREKDILNRTGGVQGCTHIGLMMVDAARALQTLA